MTSSRPVKLACLVCRASKIRCDGQNPCANCRLHQEQCRYEPSRRGGARRGPLAAQELARKKAQRLARNSSANSYNRDSGANGQGYHWAASDSVPLPPSSPSPIEPGPQLPGVSLENLDISFPSPLSGDAQELQGPLDMLTSSIRAYSCDQDLINAYYIFIHPYFPLLPPPGSAQYEDNHVILSVRSPYADASTLPYWPTSPLGLALAAMLAPIPPQRSAQAKEDGTAALRRSYADLYARSALESLQDSLEVWSHGDLADDPRSTLHPEIPRRMEPVLALGLLSLYEYCQRGSIPRMRAWANQALTAAMDLSLHMENPETGCWDAHRRCWWATLFLVYQSSILYGSDPIITFDDHRITTMFPEFRGCREPWPLVVNAQVALLRSCSIARALIRETSINPRLPASTSEDIQNLEVFILSLAAEVDRFRCVTHYQGTEADASRNLWAIANALIHTSRLTLHRVRAFPERPLFHDKPYDLLAIHTLSRPAHDIRLSTGRIAEINAVFKHTEQEAVQICLQSALVVSRVFRRLAAPNPSYSDTVEVGTALPSVSRRRLASPRSVPYMAICQMQSFYVLAILLRRVHAAMCSGTMNSYAYLLDRTSVISAVQDAERLVEELQCGMEALGNSIRADAVFEGVGTMTREVEAVFESMVMD
ncbi:Zn(II)2Cys6 transcription factor [Aspergillus undulatus]|uniref:Zn(II)2Cys6 transcription factor n=1 Tax=Aspergillus undulatus TaxID=1810928 RepID=UPI003CCDDDCE